jgi:hypothetical protein
MAKRISMLLILVVLMTVSVTSQQAGLAQQPGESHVGSCLFTSSPIRESR